MISISITGPLGSGKTAIAQELVRVLHDAGFRLVVLQDDNETRTPEMNRDCLHAVRFCEVKIYVKNSNARHCGHSMQDKYIGDDGNMCCTECDAKTWSREKE